jgi:hypothetical protein
MYSCLILSFDVRHSIINSSLAFLLLTIHLVNDTHGTTRFEGSKYLQTHLDGQIFSPSFVVLEKFGGLFPNPQMT